MDIDQASLDSSPQRTNAQPLFQSIPIPRLPSPQSPDEPCLASFPPLPRAGPSKTTPWPPLQQPTTADFSLDPATEPSDQSSQASQHGIHIGTRWCTIETIGQFFRLRPSHGTSLSNSESEPDSRSQLLQSNWENLDVEQEETYDDAQHHLSPINASPWSRQSHMAAEAGPALIVIPSTFDNPITPSRLGSVRAIRAAARTRPPSTQAASSDPSPESPLSSLPGRLMLANTTAAYDIWGMLRQHSGSDGDAVVSPSGKR
jgi:hypothetical protein